MQSFPSNSIFGQKATLTGSIALYEIEMYDLTVQKCFNAQNLDKSEVIIDTENRKTGLYFVKCTTTGGDNSTIKFILKNK